MFKSDYIIDYTRIITSYYKTGNYHSNNNLDMVLIIIAEKKDNYIVQY